MLISPTRTFQNWGNSSRLRRRMNLPKGKMRWSSESACLDSAAAFSGPTYIERNLSMQKIPPCLPLLLPRVKQRPRRLDPLHDGHPCAEGRQYQCDDRERDRDVKRALDQAVERVLEGLLLERVEMPTLLGDGDKRLGVPLLDVAVDQEPAARGRGTR